MTKFSTRLISYIMDTNRSVNRSALLASLNDYDVFHSENECEDRFVDWLAANPLKYCPDGLARAQEALGVSVKRPDDEYDYTVPLTVRLKVPAGTEVDQIQVNLALIQAIRDIGDIEKSNLTIENNSYFTGISSLSETKYVKRN